MDARRAAHHRAFELLEAVQGEDHAGAAAAIEAADAEAGDWPEVRFVLAAARVVYAVVRPPDGVDVPRMVEQLLEIAPEPAAVAVALGLKGLMAAGEGDTALLLAYTSRAVALLDDPALPGPERCLAYVISAAALNTLRLWELVEELYARATADVDAARVAAQSAAVAVNRVLIGVEHGLALLQYGDEQASRERLRHAALLVDAALAEDLRPLWRHDVEAARDVVRLMHDEPLARPVEEHRALLQADHDVEVLPLLEAAAALAAWRRDGDSGPARRLLLQMSRSSGARSFPLWVRAHVLGARDPSAAVEAERAHAQLVTRLLWESRQAVLSAARAQITVERRRAEHDRLAQVAHTDPLTGLHNRRRFEDWLQRPGTSGRAALLLLDLDHFKGVNDRFGHGTGDEVLRRIGLFLRAAVRPGDLAVRQGGDEFALVLHDPELDGASVLHRAHEIADAVRDEDWERLAPGLTVAVSVGAALAEVVPGALVGQALYEAADAALYRAKRGASPPVLAEPVSFPGPGSLQG